MSKHEVHGSKAFLSPNKEIILYGETKTQISTLDSEVFNTQYTIYPKFKTRFFNLLILCVRLTIPPGFWNEIFWEKTKTEHKGENISEIDGIFRNV